MLYIQCCTYSVVHTVLYIQYTSLHILHSSTSLLQGPRLPLDSVNSLQIPGNSFSTVHSVQAPTHIFLLYCTGSYGYIPPLLYRLLHIYSSSTMQSAQAPIHIYIPPLLYRLLYIYTFLLYCTGPYTYIH